MNDLIVGVLLGIIAFLLIIELSQLDVVLFGVGVFAVYLMYLWIISTLNNSKEEDDDDDD